ncbi:hypothetical protein SAMN02910406_02460 [Ruminococcus albus]|uniref:Fibronectin type-III domain-containing protein n=1 Tax=Ruminococcus albus TaxID=1264 RepID=A0A1I1MDX0_RUMAL|nr:hypothetical protein SAMN02910406_02460 [Ruminococcus albus]
MKMTKTASKATAILCAMTVMMPAAGAVPSAVASFSSSAVVASADSIPDWNATSYTGDQFVNVGSKFTFKVTLGPWVKNAKFQWQVAYYGTNYSWQNLSGMTTDTLTGTMTSKLNGAHIRCVVTDTDRNLVEETSARTLSAAQASAKLGTPVLQSNGYYKIPLTITGLRDNAIGTFCPGFKVTTSSIDAIKFEYNDDNWAVAGDNMGAGFFQQNNPIDDDNDGNTDRVEKVPNYYRLQYATVMTPAVLGSDNVFGYLYVKPKSGVTSLNIDMVEDQTSSLYGSADKYEGTIIYGMSYAGTSIGSSGSSATVPSNIKVNYSTQYHQVQFVWDKVQGADKYGIAVYLAGKWRIQTSNITTNSFVTPKNLTPGMTYKVAIAARVNGTWDTAGAIKNAVTVTVK